MSEYYFSIATGYDLIPKIEKKCWDKIEEISKEKNLRILILTQRPQPTIFYNVPKAKKAGKLKLVDKPSKNHSKFLQYQKYLEGSVVLVDNVLDDTIKDLLPYIKAGVFISYTDKNKLRSWIEHFNPNEIAL